MRIKHGVSIRGIRPETVLGALIADGVMRKRNIDTTLTSVTDGKHGTGSLHYVGLAYDLRTNDIMPADMMRIPQELKDALGPEFDVVVEPDHIHIEYQPK